MKAYSALCFSQSALECAPMGGELYVATDPDYPAGQARGFHLVTDELLAGLPELKACRVGLLHLWLQHTSASLTINENADPAVRRDFERFSTCWCHKVAQGLNITTKVG